MPDGKIPEAFRKPGDCNQPSRSTARTPRVAVCSKPPLCERKSTMNKPKAATKSAMFQELAEKTQLSRKQVAEVFDALEGFIQLQVSKKGPGIVALPNLLKIKRVEKAATKPRPGRNPQTGEAIIIKGKPKRTVIKVLALKKLKEMVK
jgi:nucleoid DNA-binding protein